jgi:hypothetical protein
MLNFAALSDAPLNTDPYPFMVVKDAILDDKLAQVTADFPKVDYPGSLPITEVEGGGNFNALIEQLNGPEFRSLIEQKFGLDLGDHPIMTTVRGVMRTKDGRIHTDSKTKVITVLIYFNEEWDQDGGRLRILRNGQNIEDYVDEIAPLAGTMVAFQVTDNCWHGHTPVEGKRQSIQLNYLTGDAAKGKHQFFHRISAKLKKTFGK